MAAELIEKPARSWAYAAGLGAAVVVALALRIGPLSESIWYDEWCRTSGWLNADNLSRILWRDVHNPLYNAFMYLWIGVFGDSELSIRLPSLLAGCASALIFAAWAGRRFGRGVGTTVGAWLLASPVHIWWSSEAKNVIFVSAWAMLALVAFDELAQRPGWRRGAIAALTVAGALWTDFVTLAAIVPAAACALAAPEAGPIDHVEGARPGGAARRMWGVIGAVALGLASAAPLAILKATHSGDLTRDYLRPFRVYDWAMLVMGHYLCGDAIFPESRQREYLAMALAVPVLAVLGRGWWRAVRAPSGRAAALVFVGVPAAFLVATPIIEALWKDQRHYVFQARNTIVMLGPFALVLALGCWSLRRKRERVAASVLFVALNVAAGIMMQTLYAERPTVMVPAEHYDTAARMIVRDAAAVAGRPGNAPAQVRVFAKALPQPLSYYEPAIVASTSWGGPPEYESIAASLREGGPVYFLNSREFQPLFPGEEARLRSMARMVAVGKVGRLEAYRLEPAR